MVSKIGLKIKHYELIAELIGKAKDIDEFYRLFVEFARKDNEKFNVEKFYNWMQKFKQFGGIGCGCPELAEEAQESDGQPDEAQEWHDYDPEC